MLLGGSRGALDLGGVTEHYNGIGAVHIHADAVIVTPLSMREEPGQLLPTPHWIKQSVFMAFRIVSVQVAPRAGAGRWVATVRIGWESWESPRNQAGYFSIHWIMASQYGEDVMNPNGAYKRNRWCAVIERSMAP